MMRLNLDANLENADWAKRTWDFHLPVPAQADLIAGPQGTALAQAQAKVDAFLRLPVARAMPAAVRAELRRRGLRVPASEPGSADGAPEDAP